LVLGLCIVCSVVVPHGADDDDSRLYLVRNLAPPAFVTGSSSGNITITPDPARLTFTMLAPIVTVGVPASSST
jgi:hypothetical protein